MKKVLLLALINLLMLGSCDTHKRLITCSVMKPDSTVVAFYGKEISNIIFSPEKVNFYKIRPKTKNDSVKNLIGEFAIDSLVGEIDSSYYSILLFMLCDSTNYKIDTAINKCHFSPYVAYEFIKHQKRVSVLLNLGCQQWGIAYKDTMFYEENNCENKLIRFTHSIIPKDKYINNLINSK